MKRFLSLALTFALLLGVFGSPVMAASSPQKGLAVSRTVPGVHVAKAATVGESLLEAFSTSEKATYIVRLWEEADLYGACDAAVQKAAANGLRGKPLKIAGRAAVVRALRETASRSQARLLGMLEKWSKDGQVEEYKPFWVINAVRVTSTKKVMEEIARLPEVKELFLNERVQLIETTPEAPAESGALPTGEAADAPRAGPEAVEWNVQMVEAPAVWGLGYDGTGVVVANLDTGVDWEHPALMRKWRGYDREMGAPGELAIFSWFDAINGQALPYDDHGHGTHTMGTICGSDEEGINQIGVAPAAKWIAAKVLDASGSGWADDIIAAGQWLVAPTDAQGTPHPEYAPDAVNNSWGGPPVADDWFRDIVRAWRAAGIFPSFSAGNRGPGSGTIGCPANYPESFAVGAVDRNGNLAGFSSRGPSPYGEIKPEVVAPGVGVRSSVPGGGYEGGWSGTSMACPHAVGVAALLLDVDPSLTVDELEEIITQTATPIQTPEYPGRPNNGFGWGLVSAMAAVSEVLGAGTVRGRVLTAGDDLEAPTVDHEPPPYAYQGFDVPVMVEASDNVSVVSVEVFARRCGEEYFTYIPLDRVSGDHKNGVYAGVIPWFLFVVGVDAEYFVRVRDYGGNVVELPGGGELFHVQVKIGEEPGYEEDFEGSVAPVGWTHGGVNDCWQWGIPTYGPNAAHSGEKLFATNLSGPYPNRANCYLLMPPLDLTGVIQAYLRFWHWYDLETGYDYGDVYVSTDGENWDHLAEFNGVSGGWRKELIDLSPYAGNVVYVLFNLWTDSSVQKAGWYIDDVKLLGSDDEPPLTPEGLEAQITGNGDVRLTWTPGTEEDLGGYTVYRKVYGEADFSSIGFTLTASFIDSSPVRGVENAYRVSAVDLWGNESEPSEEVIVVPPAVIVVYSTDFESGEQGWTHGGTGDCWQLGVPTSGPGAAHSGLNVWATNLSGYYNNNMNAWLASPTVDLTVYANPVLSFWHWYEIETSWDKGFVEVTRDGSSWTTVAQFSHSTAGRAWTQVTVDLSAYGGQVIRVRFRLQSDSSVTKLGWYIDDFTIQALPSGTTVQADILSWVQEGVSAPDKLKPEKEGPLFSWDDVRTGTPDDYRKVQRDNPVESESLPLEAVVSIEETGRSTTTDPATGTYSLRHVAGDWTIRAWSYGYYPVTEPVTIRDDEVTEVNFVLEPIPRSAIVGTVADRNTGEPISGAEVCLVEDPMVSPVLTDENGEFVLECFIGEYTLHVSAPTYYPADVPVTVVADEPTVVTVELRPFVGYPGELVYDDGTAENAWAYYDPGNGWAVRMTPEGGSAMLTTVSFRFWDASWPNPGGTAFKWAVFDSSGPDGSPGNMIAGPFDALAKRDGSWTVIDCRELGIVVTGDFYVAYIQAAPYPNCPGLATDENGPWYARSWSFVGGSWEQRPGDEGNTMIRASVMYAVAVPAITSPEDGTVTNQPEIVVQGLTSPNVEVRLYEGEEEVGRTTADAGGIFEIPVTLTKEVSVFTAKAFVEDRWTDPSAPVTVYLDQVAPVLTVTAPEDSFITNRDAVVVEGSVSDSYFAALTVNGEAVEVIDGTFRTRVLLGEEDGLYTITVVALDKAGNSTEVVRSVTKDTVAPEITGMVPAEDIEVLPGDEVAVSFRSGPGLAFAGFQIVLPVGAQQVGGFTQMTEDPEDPGLYTGVWTVPAGLVVDGATVQFRAVDTAGNVAEAVAPGRIMVPQIEPLAITTGSLPQGRAGDAYSQTLSAQGGRAPYTWAVAQGSLPAGLALDAGTGTISGTPTTAGTSTFTIAVTDSLGTQATKAFSITIAQKSSGGTPGGGTPGGGTPGGGMPPGGVSAAAPPVTSAQGLISAETGGKIGDEKLGFVLSAEASSVRGNTVVKVERKTEPAGAPVIPGTVFEARATMQGQPVTRFGKPVSIVIHFKLSDLPAGVEADDLFVAMYSDKLGKWMAVPTTVDMEAGTAMGKTIHLSTFALVAMPEMKTLSDVPGHWAEEFIVALQSLGIISGRPDGTFKPDDVVTRAEFVTLVGSAMGLEPVDASGSPLTDIANHWAAGYIEACRQAGLLMETEGLFRPGEAITRAEMVVVLGRAMKVNPFDAHTGFEDDASIPAWARGYVGILRNKGIISGKPGNVFEPSGTGTRGESAKIVWEILMR